jgi:hypothetical protein
MLNNVFFTSMMICFEFGCIDCVKTMLEEEYVFHGISFFTFLLKNPATSEDRSAK